MDLAIIIEVLIPSAQYGGSTSANDENSFNSLRWEDTRTKPSWADILAVTQTQIDIANYAELRVKAYSSLSEQLDMQYKDALNGTTTWRDHIATVKGLYPKA